MKPDQCVDVRAMFLSNPLGLQLTTFNHQVNIFVGGKRDVSGHLVRHFHGTMAGACF